MIANISFAIDRFRHSSNCQSPDEITNIEATTTQPAHFAIKPVAMTSFKKFDWADWIATKPFLFRLLEWIRHPIAEFDWWRWDRQIARDAKAGKLDKLAAEATTDLNAGRHEDL